MDYLEQKKLEAHQLNITAAYLLWFFLGSFGAHRFYCKKPHAVTMLVLELIGWISAVFVIGFIPLMIVFVWWIIDAFKVNTWVKAHNLGMIEAYQTQKVSVNDQGLTLNA